MKKSWIVSGVAIFVVFVIMFIFLTPKSPNQATIAIVTVRTGEPDVAVGFISNV